MKITNLTKLNFDAIYRLVWSALIFVIILDPPNTLFQLKDPLFILCLILSLNKKPDYKLFIPFVLAMIIWIFSTLFGIINNTIEDWEFNKGMIKVLIPLILLGWIKYVNLTKYIVLPGIIISIITIVLSVIMTKFPTLATATYTYFSMDKSVALMSHRSYLGFSLNNVYYKSIPILILPYAVYCYKAFKTKTIRSYLTPLLFGLALFCGGTRACILSSLFMPVAFFILDAYSNNRIQRFLFLLFAFLTIGLTLIYLLATESEESSNMVKFGHLPSYVNLFSESISNFIIGTGAGSKMWSWGFGTMTVQTEWTYLELIRYFGIAGGAIILSIFIYPLLYIFTNKELRRKHQAILIGYLFFLLVAGTNPMLLSSNGILCCWLMYNVCFYRSKRYEHQQKTSYLPSNLNINSNFSINSL